MDSAISIHVPLAGDDAMYQVGLSPKTIFLSTSPLRGTTAEELGHADSIAISIHVPLAGDDKRQQTCAERRLYFYPRPPCGGRRLTALFRMLATRYFYPRPPCGGRLPASSCKSWRFHFYPRPPCGGRHKSKLYWVWAGIFLSTSPLRGTTHFNGEVNRVTHISIHVPLAGDDRCSTSIGQRRDRFLSTSPLRGTTSRKQLQILAFPFLSTSPLRGTTQKQTILGLGWNISIHVPLAGDDAF